MMNKTCYCLGYDILYPNVYVPIALPYLSERLTFILHDDFFATINVIHVPIALPYLSERLTFIIHDVFFATINVIHVPFALPYFHDYCF